MAGKPSIGSDPATRQASATQVLVASMPHNLHKAFETSDATSRSPPRPGPFPDGLAIGGRPAQARVDGSKQVLTTKQGVPIADNQNSLKAGLRGPTLLEDFILCEKITHFERADRRPGPVRDPSSSATAAVSDFTCEPCCATTSSAPRSPEEASSRASASA